MNKADRTAEAEPIAILPCCASAFCSPGRPSPTLPKLVEKETDPRERRQLDSPHRAREIFERALARKAPKPVHQK